MNQAGASSNGLGSEPHRLSGIFIQKITQPTQQGWWSTGGFSSGSWQLQPPRLWATQASESEDSDVTSTAGGACPARPALVVPGQGRTRTHPSQSRVDSGEASTPGRCWARLTVSESAAGDRWPPGRRRTIRLASPAVMGQGTQATSSWTGRGLGSAWIASPIWTRTVRKIVERRRAADILIIMMVGRLRPIKVVESSRCCAGVS